MKFFEHFMKIFLLFPLSKNPQLAPQLASFPLSLKPMKINKIFIHRDVTTPPHLDFVAVVTSRCGWVCGGVGGSGVCGEVWVREGEKKGKRKGDIHTIGRLHKINSEQPR